MRGPIMILAGRNLSPFTRRCAISLIHAGMSYEMDELNAAQEKEKVQQYNKLGRVPALKLDDGTCLVDSWAILDWIDQTAGPDKALVPASSDARRDVLRLTAYAMGTMEKAVAYFYETGLRPEDKRWKDWGDRLGSQVVDGFTFLEEALGDSEWLHGNRMTQADITTVCAYDFATVRAADLLDGGKRFPKLAAFTDRCNKLEPFAKTNLDPYRG
ncbi:glutathione S-transferase family protein [Fodinicurvata fenggangensis]|uniref:glutathione S-transferase family protein n=1 Tax=Fodinicurvata fenggangensis TaxID=1121830 RepID=UPI000691B074|nr:glutathione S-transferase family protein [Fodinicurvata fenggangensis]